MRKLSFLNVYHFILVCSICFFLPNQTSGQENDIYELSLVSSSESNNNKDNDRDQFYDLLFNLHPTIYITNGVITTIYGEGDIKKLSVRGTNSFKLLTNPDVRYNQVELITVILKSSNELNSVLNLSDETELNELKYIFVECHFDIQKDNIEKFIHVKPNVRVFYLSVNPS